jgi:hypothetical protein
MAALASPIMPMSDDGNGSGRRRSFSRIQVPRAGESCALEKGGDSSKGATAWSQCYSLLALPRLTLLSDTEYRLHTSKPSHQSHHITSVVLAAFLPAKACWRLVDPSRLL